MTWWDDLPYGETVDGDDPYDTQRESLRLPDPYVAIEHDLDETEVTR